MVVEAIRVCIIASGCNTIREMSHKLSPSLKGRGWEEWGIYYLRQCIVWHPQYLMMGSHHLIAAE